MVVIENAETLGLRPFHEFDEAGATWPRGERLDAIRSAAEEFRGRFKDQGQVTAVRTIDLVTAGYPAKYALGGRCARRRATFLSAPCRVGQVPRLIVCQSRVLGTGRFSVHRGRRWRRGWART